jgi:hypothetical protein
MKEELLHFIWQSKRLLVNELRTVTGQKLDVLHPGTYNADAGPDFFNSKISLEHTTWAGNIEVHIKSSDWTAHRHHTDSAYDNVILHVVLHYDKPAYTSTGYELPTLELRHILPPFLLKRYERLMQSRRYIACEELFAVPDDLKLNAWITRLLIERIEQKTDTLQWLLNETQQNWEQSFYVFTARYFGFKTNAQPFVWLARSLPLQVIAKHKNSLFQLEALVLGMSGLPALEHKFPEWKSHKQEFEFLALKYGLKPLQPDVWKFSRTRPANFPSVRLLQFARLIYHSSHLLSKVLDAKTLTDLRNLYTCEHEGKRVLSDDSIDLLLVNSVLPAIFLYGKTHNRAGLCDRVLEMYEQIPAESNAITRYFKKAGIPVKNSFDAQAVIQLKTAYCEAQKCLHCAIGKEVLWNGVN